jgi:hypothetical protein
MSNNVQTLISIILIVLGYIEALKTMNWYKRKNLMWIYWTFAIVMPLFLIWACYMYISRL